MMKTLPARFFAALLAVSGVALGQERLAITGSSTMAPLVAELAKAFSRAQPGVAISVEAGSSARGVTDARSGQAGIGMVSRPLHADEKKDLFAVSIARDAVAFAVHRDNRVAAITREQITAILRGRPTNWKALGGSDAPVRLMVLALGHGEREIVAEYCGMDVGEIKGPREVHGNAEALRAVMEDPHAFAFLSLGIALAAGQARQAFRLLAVDGVPPSAAEARSGRYPLSRPLLLVTREVPRGAALAFIRRAQSHEAHAAIRAHFFIPYLPLRDPGR